MTGATEEDVAGLEIPVDDVPAVKGLEGDDLDGKKC